jgi:methylenetetrahydrofolate reductase (NADPH)
MTIVKLIGENKPFLSLEFFPPKEKGKWEEFFRRVEELKVLSPLFVSITCGAGGSSTEHTLAIASYLQNSLGLETMAHLTCFGSRCREVSSSLAEMEAAGIRNVLALRGDPPKAEAACVPASSDFRYASDLVTYIREKHPGFSIGVAAYPEAHPESPSRASDLKYLKEKLEKGADFLITQFFFDNRIYFDFVDRLRDMGVESPVIPGVLPVLSLRSLRHILSLSGASIPGRLYLKLEEANEKGGPDEVRRLGIEFARKQIRGLLEGGAPGIHLYTLNNAGPMIEIASGLL